MAEQEILALPLSNGNEGVFLAKKSGGIYRAIMDNDDSTATAFVLTCDDISSLYDGIIITCKNTKVASAANCTINLNGLGAKRIWCSQSNGYCTTHWGLNQTYLFIYDATNERWELQQGRDTDGNDTSTVRPYYSHPTAGVNGIKQYGLFARTADGKYTSFTTNSGTGTKTFDTETYYDIRKIFYYNGSGNVATDTRIGNNTMTYSNLLFDCRYTLNGVTTSASTSALVANKPLYLIFDKEDNKYGCFKLKSPFWTQDPATLEDNGSNIYVLVGYVYDSYRCDLFVDNPAFHKIYDGSVGSGQLFPYVSANDINGKAVNADIYTGEPLVYCNASGSDRIKVAKCEGFAGDGISPCYMFVHMENSNTYDGAIALQINDQDYLPIWINGAASSADNGELPSGLYFVYFDGTHYHFNVGEGVNLALTAPIIRGNVNNRLALAAQLVTITGSSSATGIKFDGYGSDSGNICQVIQTSLHNDNQTVMIKGNKILTRANDYYLGNINGTSSTLPTIHVSSNADAATITFDLNGDVFINDKRAMVEESGAGFHNSVYRGKNLGTGVTSTQYEAIGNGTFDDLYVGDYWAIGSYIYRIAAFDYWYNTGDTKCTKHHAVLVLEQNSSGLPIQHITDNTSLGSSDGYYNSTFRGGDNYPTGGNVSSIYNTIVGVFGSHLLVHRELLTTATSNGVASNSTWCDSSVELLSEYMVFGNCTSNSMHEMGIDNSILPLFALDKQAIAHSYAQQIGFRTIYDGKFMGLAANGCHKNVGNNSNCRAKVVFGIFNE